MIDSMSRGYREDSFAFGRLLMRLWPLCLILIPGALIPGAQGSAAQQSAPAAEIVRPVDLPAANLPAPSHDTPPGVIRVIHDPGGNAYWLLSADPMHPAGPGRLDRISADATLQRNTGNTDGPAGSLPAIHRKQPDQNAIGSTRAAVTPPPARTLPNLIPVIRAGDRIILEQHTDVLDSTLSAIALGPARPGQLFEARLTTQGKRLHAIALSAGRALIAPQQELSAFGDSQ